MWRSVLVLAFCLALPAAAQDVSMDAARAPNGTYRLEASHSQLVFSVLHLGLTDYFGRFDKMGGTLSFDGNQPEKSFVSVTIDTSSVDTPSSRLNDTLKADVFATDRFAVATFQSVSIVRTGRDSGRILGNLTIKNVTRPVTLEATFTGGEQDPLNGAYALGFHATATIKRSEFGLTDMSWTQLVGDDVHLIISAMFTQEKD